MKSTEAGVFSNSNYYIHTPSLQAQQTFLYPLFIGSFDYKKGYSIKRNSFDSYLIMYIKKGELTVSLKDVTFRATENQVVFLDCFKPHEYTTNNDCTIEWIHIDGIVAGSYFNLITQNKYFVFSLKDTLNLRKNFNKIYDLFNENKPIKEAVISLYITNILTELITQQTDKATNNITSSIIEETISYINENLTSSLNLETLALRGSLSPYYFSRFFKKETGFSPYQYVLYARINHAKFLLKNTELPVKEISFLCGFTSESRFCTSFKQWVNTTPSNYRSKVFEKEN